MTKGTSGHSNRMRKPYRSSSVHDNIDPSDVISLIGSIAGLGEVYASILTIDNRIFSIVVPVMQTDEREGIIWHVRGNGRDGMSHAYTFGRLRDATSNGDHAVG